MLTLADINNLPNDPNEDHLRALGLLPQPAPAPSIIPPAKNIPAPSPVTPAPAVSSGWRAKLAATIPHIAAPLPPLTTPIVPSGAGMEPASPIAPTPGPESPLAGTNFPKLAPLNFKERQALPTTSAAAPVGSANESLAELARLQDQKANPWGSPENHPGILGKIGHYAAKIGNIAGDILAPATMANIPGTDLNKQIQERELKGEVTGREKAEEEAKDNESLRELRSAEAKRALREPEREGNSELETYHDLMTGDNGNPRINPDTKQPYTALEAYEATKQAGQKQPVTGKENLQQGLAGAIQDALDKGEDPAESTAVKAWSDAIQKFAPAKEKDVNTAEDLKHRIALAIEKGDAKEAKTLESELMDLNPDAKARLAESQASLAATQEDRREKREDKLEKEGRTLVRVRDEKTGKTYVEPLSKAKADGISDAQMEEVPAGEKVPIQDARLVVKTLTKKGTKPEEQGVFQLIDGLDKDGKLGVVQSRLNSWLAGGVGTLPGDDPRIVALLDKADLAMTLSMKAHFGVSGGRSPQMLEHFLNLANAKKMDGPALRAGFKAVNNYMEDRAEMPPTSGGGGGGGKAEGVQIHNGFEYTKGADGQWHKGKPVQP